MDPDKIVRLRETIDELDNSLLDSLSARFQLMPSILAYKQAKGLSIADEKREERIIAKMREKAAELGMNPRFIEQLFLLIIAESKRIQEGLLKK